MYILIMKVTNEPKIKEPYPSGYFYDAMEAKLKWTLALADNNIPFRFSGTFSKLLPELCPDSKIAFLCRTKTSYIIRHAFGETFAEELKVEPKGTFVS